MNKKNILALVSAVVILVPMITLAQVGGSPPALGLNLTQIAENIAKAMWIIFTAVAVVMFVTAGILFLTAQGQPEKIATARQAVIWGIAGVVVAILAFTIISFTTSLVSSGV
jgi:uncharacterized membrane protein YjfL (UPF0719 family)